MRKLILIVVILLIILGVWNTASSYLPSLIGIGGKESAKSSEKVKIVSEESVVVSVVEKISPSVVTVGIEQRIINFDPFDIFSGPQAAKQEQDIGSGFVVSGDGLIVTNKHVVDAPGKYKVITHDGKKYDVKSVYRDPVNDIAIVKIDASGLKPVEMGDSSTVKVGQLVVAVGTPLGEFRGSVTKGIVSGIGRGITAGSAFEGFAEKIDDVIQTDAAINPGNSGGPLVNSSGQVIGVNTAIASGAENIGFALPINIIKDSLSNFNKSGQFNRPYLGIAYKMLKRDIAALNDIPQGAYVQTVMTDSPAEKAGIVSGDIITNIDGEKVGADENTVAAIVTRRKIGDVISVSLWRSSKTLIVKATLVAAPNQ
ncbi:MAG: trypsin-like peptidase domain-containing protein [Candidatus Levybacteria bacterium]|nr:trypsin-like peptidase domain-containing protein [Candidatus Levybacteria bacterium]